MCGFCGFSYKDKELLTRASKTLFHRNNETPSLYYHHCLSLYHASLRLTDITKEIIQPIETSDNIVSFVGEIYNTEYLIEKFLTDNTILTECELIERLFYILGKSFVEYLNGEFVIYIYSKKEDKHYLFRDRYGTRCLYYSIVGKQIFFSSEIKTLLEIGISDKINRESLQDYLVFGYSISPNTIFENISSLKPGTILEFSKGKKSIETYGRYISQEKNQDFLEAFEKSVIRRIPREHDTVFLSLSGGLDSNLILYFLLKNYSGKIVAYSFKNKSNIEDVAYAQRNADIFGIEHHIINIEESYHAEYSSQIVHEGLVKLIDFSKILRQALPQYKNVHIEFSGDGREEIFQNNTHFDTEAIQKKVTFFNMKHDITGGFLNTSMLDYNLQLIEKITLGQLLERRLPFTDYEIKNFTLSYEYKEEIAKFLRTKGFQLVPQVFGHNNAIEFSYLFSKHEIIIYLRHFLKQLKNINYAENK